jgi:Fic family protein
MDFTPHLPKDLSGSYHEDLICLAQQVFIKSSTLTGSHTKQTIDAVVELLFIVNSYYSNMIESEGTHPANIERAMQKQYDDDTKNKNLQILSLCYIDTQKSLFEEDSSLLYSVDLVKKAHFHLYSHKGMESFLRLTHEDETFEMVPGKMRQRNVEVGRHIAPKYDEIESLLEKMSHLYSFEKNRNLTEQIIATMAYHHRLAWAHPFLDGNGRVSRLILDFSLKKILGASYGLWNISRGLARNNNTYKTKLHNADMKRLDDRDGRGDLSQKHLYEFVKFMLEQSLDQIEFMSECLKLETLAYRIEEYVRVFCGGAFTKPFPKGTSTILKELLLKGEIARGEVDTLLGISRRLATEVVKKLLELGFVRSEGNRGKLRIAFPVHMSQYIFHDLIPIDK